MEILLRNRDLMEPVINHKFVVCVSLKYSQFALSSPECWTRQAIYSDEHNIVIIISAYWESGAYNVVTMQKLRGNIN